MRIETATAGQCRKSLTRLANALLRGDISAKEAGTAGYLVNLCLQSLRLDDLEKKIAELETELEGQENGNNTEN